MEVGNGKLYSFPKMCCRNSFSNNSTGVSDKTPNPSYVVSPDVQKGMATPNRSARLANQSGTHLVIRFSTEWRYFITMFAACVVEWIEKHLTVETEQAYLGDQSPDLSLPHDLVHVPDFRWS
jgi:hypothetical protein